MNCRACNVTIPYRTPHGLCPTCARESSRAIEDYNYGPCVAREPDWRGYVWDSRFIRHNKPED